jgi:hypothetical protein
MTADQPQATQQQLTPEHHAVLRWIARLIARQRLKQQMLTQGMRAAGVPQEVTDRVSGQPPAQAGMLDIPSMFVMSPLYHKTMDKLMDPLQSKAEDWLTPVLGPYAAQGLAEAGRNVIQYAGPSILSAYYPGTSRLLGLLGTAPAE